MERSHFFLILKKQCVRAVSALCAVWMLCLLPLIFRNAFFDINRIKVYSVYAGVPILTVLMCAALYITYKKERFFPPEKPVALCLALMAVFLFSCVLSYVASGFRSVTLLGNQGRYCGLLFFLCCAAAFAIISLGKISAARILPLIQLCSCFIALLGILNALGIDPLGFYERIRKGQEKVFMSTIGHFDFFGTYLVMMLPLSGASFIFSKKTSRRIIGFIGAVLTALGAAASRTDSALLGVQLGCAALFALSGSEYRYMARALVIWSVGFLSLPVVNVLLNYSKFDVAFTGPHALLCERHIALAAALICLGAAALTMFLSGRQIARIGRKKCTAAVLITLSCVVMIFAGMMVYFTRINTTMDLGGAQGFLRFDDKWGSCRGFVYTRALDAYGQYSILEKLLGKGLDTTKLILEPYFDHPVVQSVGIFDDAHNQLLQLLLTGGLFCMVSFAALYAGILFTLYRSAGRDPLVCGAAASVFAYSIVMLINVTQPILIATYFSISALGLSRVGYLSRRRRRQADESDSASGAAQRKSCLYGERRTLGNDSRERSGL